MIESCEQVAVTQWDPTYKAYLLRGGSADVLTRMGAPAANCLDFCMQVWSQGFKVNGIEVQDAKCWDGSNSILPNGIPALNYYSWGYAYFNNLAPGSCNWNFESMLKVTRLTMRI